MEAEEDMKKQVEEESVKVGLKMEDELCCSKWIVGVIQIAAGLRWVWPHSRVGETTKYYTLVFLSISLSNIALFPSRL